MKKMWKRFVSLLLACTLLAGMLPLSASAVSEPTDSQWITEKIEEINAGLEQGEQYHRGNYYKLGDSDLYRLTFTRTIDTETATITDAVIFIVPGTDANENNSSIPDYNSLGETPWEESSASAVYIADGVTGIGNHAFDGMSTLETLEIQNPDSLTRIGDYAFNGCDQLQGTDGKLDLSGVTEMGSHAFNGCERLDTVTLGDGLTEIPEYAFNGCGLTSVNIPEKVTSIGNSAFANNSLSGELNLPSSLITIGERAFYRYNSSSPTGGFSSITIPSSVMEIGANAFSGHKSLETVTLEHENKEKLTIENGAFGTDTYTAHNYLDSIKVGDITYENVSMGTQFLTKNNVGELLNNGVNCYLGDLKPLKFDHTDLPTCLTPGYRYYEMTLEGASTENEPIVVETKIEIPAPDHSYVECEDLPATCTQPERTHEHCTNLDKGLVRSCEEEEKIRIKEGGKRALGHNYVVTDIENPTIGAGAGDTVITYTCQNWSASEDKNLHDGDNISPSYSWKIEDKAVVGSTAHTLEELNLPVVQGVGNNYYAHLEWAVDDETLEAPLEDGTHPYNVKLVVTGAGLTFPECTGIGDQLLQVTVQVDKIKLDFSQVEFQNNIRYVAQPNGVFGVLNLPEDAEIVKTEYSQNGDTWAGEAPEETEGNVGKYQVRVTFSYTSSKYLLDTEDKALQPPAGYTLAAGDKLGTGTLTGPYEIKQLTKDDLSVSSIPGLTYNGSKRNTVRIVGLPKDAKVTVTWKDAEGAEKEEIHTATETSMDVAGIINAGTYDVTIKVEHETFANGSAEITAQGVIAKKSIPIPEANTLGSYTPEKVQIGVNDPTGEYVGIYTVDNNKQINAGTYEATAILLAPNNYKWSTSEGAAVNISYTIPRRVVQKPGVTSSTYTFTGQPIEVLYRTNQERLDGKYDDSGKLTAYWKDYDTEYVVYTATDVKKTDAGDYKVTVALNNKDANNYWWAGEDAEDYSFTWTINPQSINAPAVKVNNTTYDGQPYNTGGSDITLTGQSEVLVLGEDHKFYSNQSSSDPMQEAPTNAGTYYVQVDFDFKGDLNPDNYTITGNNRQRFTIKKAELTLTEPTENLSVTYTGSDQTVPPPTVEGLQGDDTASDYSLVYTYTIGESKVTQSQTGELKLSQVGTYNISVSVSQECTNYTSNTVEYNFTISTANQTVKLTGEGLQGDGSEGKPYTISKTLGNDPFTVTGKGYVNDVVVNEDDIGYEVTGGDTQNPVVKVDPTSGEVTLLRAGSATITVTAEGSANYQEATATYTITVGKGTPEVAVQMPTGGSADNTYPYTGKALTFDATVTGASNGAVAPTTDEKVTYNFYSDDSGQKGGKIDSQPTKIGTYWVEAVYEGDDNYNEATSTAEKFTISPAALKVEATGHTDTYDGQPHDPAAITVKGVGGAPFEKDDYTVSYIEKGSDGEAKPDVDDLKWDSTLQVKDVAHSGDYWIKVVINGDDSSYDPYIGSVTVDIDPRPLTVTKDVTPTKVYDGTADATKNVEINSIDTGIEGETVTANLISAVYNSANANVDNFITITYELAEDPGTDTDLANYSLDGEAVTGAEMSEKVTEVNDTPVGITPASITVAINDQKKVYDGQSLSIENPVQDTHWSTTGTIYLQDGVKDDLDITLSIDSGSKDAGAYAITGKAENKNYKVTFTGNWQGEEGDPNNDHAGIYTITPRPIKVEIGDADGFYGDVPVLDNVALDDVTGDGVSDAGLVDGEVLKNVLTGLKLATTANAQSDISNEDTPYPIYAKKGEAPIQAPTQLGNYNVTFTNEGTYTVKQRPITITIKDHSSVYGEKIDGGIADPVSDKDYTVAITGNATTGDAIVNNDALTVTLNTTASATAAAGTYDITGSAEGEKVNNYAITWAGNGGDRDGGGKNGKYTIDKAGLKVEFDHHDKVLNGVSINITDSYNANPLVLKNASTDAEVSKADKETLDITYSIGAAGGGAGGVSQIAEINETTGEVTIHSTGTVRITAKVTANKGSNYTGTQTTWYELNIISGGQMTVNVTPKTNLAYTGDPQALLESASCSLDSAEIQYSLDNQDWQNTIPTGTNAGTYTVYVKATDPNSQYSDVTEHVTVTISKANLKGSFAQEEYTHVLTKGNSYDSATANELTIRSAGYGAEPAKYTYRSADTTVAMAENGGSTIRIMGSAGQETTITVTVPGDNNYNEGTFTYTLKISDKLSEIKYNVTGATTTYNGQPQTIAVNVTAPASGATVMYQDEDGNYTLSEPPAYTNVQEGGYPIKFQITAPGYNTVTGEAKLTINPRDISLCQVEGIAESYTYVGHQIVPETVAVVDGSVILTKDTDYTLEYGANQEVGEGEGSVIIKGTGNYTGKVIEYFDIIPVDGSSGITASIAPNFGTYDPDAPVTAEVTVTHQTGSDSHDVDLTAANAKYTISATDLVTGQAITDHGATGTGGTLTFTKPAIYDITLTLTGDHQGEFRLSYTLLPLSNDDGGLTLTVDDETQKVFTYGGEIDPSDATIKVTANNTDVTDQCTLTYVYTPFEGTPTTTASPYTAEVLENAGVYTVTATPTDGSAITGTGTFTFLILQRDLSKATLAVEDDNLVYNQAAQEPDVTVTVDGNAQPTEDADYTVTYYNNVNASKEAKAVVTAKGNNFTGSNTENFSIAPKEITDEMVKEIPEQYYTGNAVIPPVTITDGNYTLILGYDYTTACDAIGPGTATVTIEGKGNYTETTTKDFVIKSEGAPEPSERFDLVVTPSQWIWKDDLTNLRLSVTFGTGNELTLGKEYTLEVNGQTFDGTTGKTKDDALTYIKGLKPGEYTITATGVDAYKDSEDTETVTVKKIQPELTVTAAPGTLSGGGKVTLTLKGEKLPAFAEGQDLSSLLTASAKDEKNAPDLSELEWETDEQTGVMTAELTLPNTNETYTFTLTFTGNEYYEAATASEQVVVAQQIISGGGGGPVEDQPADPDDTGVSDWLNTKDHLAYLAGYPGGTFGPDQNMTRAEAAQMFYNLLLEKDVEITVEFEDVPADAWYAKPVNTLASLGILSGVGNGRFDPERSITRAEFTVIAMKFANTSGGGVNIFSDVNEDDWFYSAVVDSTQYGWINGYPDGTFRPEATISRAEVTVIVNHMLGRAADRPYVIAHEKELNTFGDVNRGHWGYFHIAEATNAHEYHTEDGTESWTGLS